MKIRKLSDDDIVQAATMRKNGASLKDIADSLGVSKQRIGVILRNTGRATCKPRNTHSIIFPSIRKYLNENRMSISRFAVLCNISGQTMNRAITGQTDMLKRTIDQILRVTGMTYEEAFKEDEKE